MPLTTVVLAGGPVDEVAILQPGTINKAFIQIAGKTLVTRTLEALRAAPSVGRLIVVAPEEMHQSTALALADETRASGIRIRDSLASGLGGLPADDLVLLSTSDLPILSTESVEEFIAGAKRGNADLAYAILERSIHEAKFPQVPHTWARMRNGTYCGGGFVAVKPRVFASLARFIERLGAARKNPMHLALLFGPDALLKFAFHRLSIAEAESRASRALGAKVRAVPCSHPEMAVNVDRASDVALAEHLIRESAHSSA